jgi:hypothetical protein
MIMDVDRVISLVSAAGIELTDRRRNEVDNGWSLSFSNGGIAASGKGAEAVASLLGLPGKPAAS